MTPTLKCGSKVTISLVLDTAVQTGLSLHATLFDVHRRDTLLLQEGSGITQLSSTTYGIVLTAAQTLALKPGNYLLEFALVSADKTDVRISVNEVPVIFRASPTAKEVLA